MKDKDNNDIKKIQSMLDAEEQTDDKDNGHYIENFYKHELSRENKKIKKLIKRRNKNEI